MFAFISSHKYPQLNNGYGKFFATYNMVACSLCAEGCEGENFTCIDTERELTYLLMVNILKILPSSASTSTSTQLKAEMALFSASPATHPPTHPATHDSSFYIK